MSARARELLRRGIRPGFGPALDLPGSGPAMRVVLPFRRSWVAIGILAFFDAAFLLPALYLVPQVIHGWSGFEDLFDLVFTVFHTAFLAGWMLAPLLMTAILAVLLFGREVISAGPGRVELFAGLPLVGLRASYRVEAMRNLRHELPEQKSGSAWRGPHLAFDYGAQTIAFGSDMTPQDLAEFHRRIEAASGQAPRTGEAHPEELSGDWDPVRPTATAAAREVGPALPVEALAWSSPSTLALLLANLVPLVGAAWWEWRLSDVMVLYWAESAIIGLYNLARMAVVGRWLAVPAGLFFLGHFSAFMAVHFLFVFMLFVKGPQDNSGGDLAEVGRLFVSLWPALAALALSHGLSFFRNFLGRGEYRGQSLQDLMRAPYSRIVFMHLVLIFGGGLTLVLGQPAPVLVAVIILKIVVDLRAHLKQHGVD